MGMADHEYLPVSIRSNVGVAAFCIIVVGRLPLSSIASVGVYLLACMDTGVLRSRLQNSKFGGLMLPI
jgi:hypothetical protein